MFEPGLASYRISKVSFTWAAYVHVEADWAAKKYLSGNKRLQRFWKPKLKTSLKKSEFCRTQKIHEFCDKVPFSSGITVFCDCSFFDPKKLADTLRGPDEKANKTSKYLQIAVTNLVIY